MKIGTTITRLRKERGLSREELGTNAGTSGAVIGRYERDEITPSVEIANKIAKALEVSLDYLTGLSDLKLDKSIVDVVTCLQKLSNEDREHIFTTINALVRDAKARNTYA